MPTIIVSNLVREAIAELTKGGGTEDDLLRQLLKLPPNPSATGTRPMPGGAILSQRRPSYGPRKSFATKRMSSYIRGKQLHISFEGGSSHEWQLPAPENKAALRSVRDQAVTFARENGATLGQVNAVKKTLTDSGYHLTK